MRSLTKLDRAMQIKRIEGKAALDQCLLDKQTLKFTSNRFVQENPWTALGLSAFAAIAVAIAVAKAGRLSCVTSSLSSISLLLNGAMDLSGQLVKSSSSSAASSKEAGEEAAQPSDLPPHQ
ncbi:hypothetical protein ACYVMA_002329 [Vibrio parahaemolyticus]|uniref:Uncharacterized protein n=1 Tax=Vibrio parahaemolyticus TaxID=670 RepID=A0AA46UIW8_VIBPH|nr:hypothetical protein [Vibrio parahaemolyticus]EXJ43109.1 hypothetical protein D047_3797 [Vibrio parahaemolyticus VPTS-2010_2]UYV26358.1 hypothetical protein M5598_15235 [Vibrio parahaemolyticus]